MVNDYFSQAAIDFFLGNVTSMVFDEFESTMMTKDPAVSMQRMREQAIETSQKIAIEDPEAEDLVGGWTMLSPRRSASSSSSSSSSLSSSPLEEVVLLLTDAALYLCRFDWKLDKVKSFERVDLRHIVAPLRVGTYVTSTLSSADVDERRNVGLLVAYRPGARDVVRTNTRSLSNMADLEQEGAAEGEGKEKGPADGLPALVPAAAAGILNAISSGGSAEQPKEAGKSKGKNQKQAPTQTRQIALKAPYARTSMSGAAAAGAAAQPGEVEGAAATEASSRTMNELELVNFIAGEIERLVLAAPTSAGSDLGSGSGGGRDSVDGGHGHGGARTGASGGGDRTIIERGDIVSLAEAKRSTGLLEQWGHSIKKLVWA